jgi:peptide chain release factor subunit 1
MSQDTAEQNIQMWKVKKLIKSLDAARGCIFFLVSCSLFSDGVLIDIARAGTSMISLIIPPKACGICS